MKLCRKGNINGNTDFYTSMKSQVPAQLSSTFGISWSSSRMDAKGALLAVIVVGGTKR